MKKGAYSKQTLQVPNSKQENTGAQADVALQDV